MLNIWMKELCCGYKPRGDQDARGLENADRFPLIKLLNQVPLLKRLSADERVLIANNCEEQNFAGGTVVIKQGDNGSEFFVIGEGEASVIKTAKDGSEQKVVALRRGDWFGENALLCDEPRVASVTAVTALSTLKISRSQFRALGLHQKLQFAKRRAVGGAGVRAVQTFPPSPKTETEIEAIRDGLWKNENLATVLHNLDDQKVLDLVNGAWLQEVEAGETIIEAGDDADYFYVVKKGKFEVSNKSEATCDVTTGNSDVNISNAAPSAPSLRPSQRASDSSPKGSSAESAMHRHLEVGDCFGELALLYLTQRTATVRASEDSTVWVIDRPNFKRVLMKKSEERIDSYAKMLDSVEILNCLAEQEKRDLANALVEMNFKEGEQIVKQGEHGKIFYILYDGKVEVSKDGQKIKDIETRGKFFGERALLADEPRTATITAVSESVRLLALDHETFGMLLGPLGDLMKEAGTTFAQRARIRTARQSLLILPNNRLQQVKFEDLVRKGLLGNGGFGCVELYQNKETGQTYALKSMSKGHIVKVGMQNAVINEKNVLLTADSPYIVKLYATYNWPKTIVFLLELLQGGELYATYTRENLWGKEVHAKYYSSVVLLGFEHLHSHRILYRDLKPENVVLNADGVPKLVDMGLAKRVVGKTYTTCGTPDYFAPEVITGAGHNHAIDWWTLGIMIYELLSGNPPFTAGAPMQIFKNVLRGAGRLTFPKKCQGSAAALVKALLLKEPSERLAMRPGGVSNVKKHDWYLKHDWVALENLTFQPTFRPSVKNPTDLSNFNARPEDMPKKVDYKDDGSGWDLEFDKEYPTLL